jgi:hypothetical protein
MEHLVNPVEYVPGRRSEGVSIEVDDAFGQRKPLSGGGDRVGSVKRQSLVPCGGNILWIHCADPGNRTGGRIIKSLVIGAPVALSIHAVATDINGCSCLAKVTG